MKTNGQEPTAKGMTMERIPPLPENEVVLRFERILFSSYIVLCSFGAIGYLLDYIGRTNELRMMIFAGMFWCGVACLLLQNIINISFPAFTVKTGDDNYWRITSAGVEAVPPGRYWNKKNAFAIFPQMSLHSSFQGQAGVIHYFLFTVELKHQMITREIAAAFCNWYAELPSHYHDHKNMIDYLRKNPNSLPFRVTSARKEPIIMTRQQCQR